VGSQDFTVIVASRIGSVNFPIKIEKPGHISFPVVIPNKIPSLYSFDSIQNTNQISDPVITRCFQIRLNHFVQKNYPINDSFYKILQYFNYWEQDIGKAEVYLLKESELVRLKIGLPIEYGDKRILDGYNHIDFLLPKQISKEKYYLVFWNPNFSTQMRVKIK